MMTCQVQQTALQLQESTQIVASNVRKLKSDLSLCQACTLGEDCHFMQEFRAAFNLALAEITLEWNLQNQRSSPNS